MQSNSFFIKIFMLFLILSSTNSRAANPNNLFGVELGQDVFKLASIEKLGSAYMNFKITPKSPMIPFDLYSVKVDNNFSVQGVFARAKLPVDECENELKKLVHKLESSLDVSFDETFKKKKTVYMSENDKTLLVLSCNRYRKSREKQLKDIVIVLASKEMIAESIEVDKVKSQKMSEILTRNRIKKTEIKLLSNHDLSGTWSLDCNGNKSGFGIKKIRDNTYHFLVCSSSKCINLPGVSSDNVEIVDGKHLKIAGTPYEKCGPWNK